MNGEIVACAQSARGTGYQPVSSSEIKSLGWWPMPLHAGGQGGEVFLEVVGEDLVVHLLVALEDRADLAFQFGVGQHGAEGAVEDLAAEAGETFAGGDLGPVADVDL